MHGIIWCKEGVEAIRERWGYGWIYPRHNDETKINYVNEKTVNYCIKYVTKIDKDHPNFKGKILCSDGIGKNYDKKEHVFKGEHTNTNYKLKNGSKVNLPIYYRNKFYSEEEREKLWLQTLDKNERWIMGEKVAADNYKEIKKLQEFYRKLNKELGYGDGSKDHDQIAYEKKLRKLKLEQIKQLVS